MKYEVTEHRNNNAPPKMTDQRVNDIEESMVLLMCSPSKSIMTSFEPKVEVSVENPAKNEAQDGRNDVGTCDNDSSAVSAGNYDRDGGNERQLSSEDYIDLVHPGEEETVQDMFCTNENASPLDHSEIIECTNDGGEVSAGLRQHIEAEDDKVAELSEDVTFPRLNCSEVSTGECPPPNKQKEIIDTLQKNSQERYKHGQLARQVSASSHFSSTMSSTPYNEERKGIEHTKLSGSIHSERWKLERQVSVPSNFSSLQWPGGKKDAIGQEKAEDHSVTCSETVPSLDSLTHGETPISFFATSRPAIASAPGRKLPKFAGDSKLSKRNVAATNETRTSVRKISEWIEDNSAKATNASPLRSSGKIISKARVFEKNIACHHTIENDRTLTTVDVGDKKKWLKDAFKNSSVDNVKNNSDAVECSSTSTSCSSRNLLKKECSPSRPGSVRAVADMFGGPPQPISGVQKIKAALEKRQEDLKKLNNPKNFHKTSWKTEVRHGAYTRKIVDERGVVPKKTFADLP